MKGKKKQKKNSNQPPKTGEEGVVKDDENLKIKFSRNINKNKQKFKKN